MKISEPDIGALRYIKGVGPKRSLVFQKIGIHSVRDLLYLFPRRYEDRSHFASLNNLPLNEPITCRGEVVDVKFKPIRGMPLVEVLIGDDAGTLRAVWFNQPYLKKLFVCGQQVILYGKVEFYKKDIQMSNPEFEIVEDAEATSIHTGRITPIYPLTEGLFQRSLRTTLREAIEHHLDGAISDTLPAELRTELDLVPLDCALREMHLPSSFEELAKARRRIVFDEFFSFELQLFLKVKAIRTQYQAHAFNISPDLNLEFKRSLPFELTKSQEKAIQDLVKDLGQTIPMNRLLQGDVGSGKTVVAAFAFLAAHRSGLQSAFLIPTEILAEQHYRTLLKFLEPVGIRPELLTKSTETEKRARLIAELKHGKVPVVVGTHALLQEDVRFKDLGLLVVDEQHKFGVHQRNQLLQKTPRPHQLVMTATPIPRTLALTVYADLDISVMKELPKGRQPIKTYWITRKKQPEIFDHMSVRIQKGEQAYIVFPLIEETEKKDLLAAKKEFERLRKTVFKKFRMGLVHGKLDRPEREAIMRAFSRKEIDILVATSVIEVGVDQPNATMMIIENAERFGLAQLHQLRGRIGRGSLESECFLFGEPTTDEGKMRLRLLTKLSDGFLIADEDLKLRGQGDLWGTRQSGEPLFRVAHPILDEAILLQARREAQKLIAGIPGSSSQKPPAWIQKYLEQMPKTD
ncbi:MAG: ATP-dependent DNA helicase RecG [Candidatus Omnitrophica bacterium]|nr:ATP-dependent DNA helicase RecG [Candidatus Omnitrophota bacterium]